MSFSITNANIDAASAAELQKYMEDHGVVDLHMRRFAREGGWSLIAKLSNDRQVAGGPFKEMKDAIAFLVRKLEEA